MTKQKLPGQTDGHLWLTKQGTKYMHGFDNFGPRFAFLRNPARIVSFSQSAGHASATRP